MNWKQAEQARTACFVAVVGTTTLRIAALRIGTTTIPTMLTTISGSGLCSSLSSKHPPDSGFSEPVCFQTLGKEAE